MENPYNSKSHTHISISSRESKDTCTPVKCIAIIIHCIAACFVVTTGCVAPFSEMQSAKLVGKGKTEVTPIFSTVHFVGNGERTHLQNEYGLQGGFGVNDKIDFRVRYELVHAEYYDPYYHSAFDINVHVIGFGPKIGLYKDMHALYLPIGFAFGEGIDISEIWQFHPTFLFTFPLGKNAEFNPSLKVLVPLTGDNDVLIAFNLGAGISGDLEKWAMRPEIGFLVNPGDNGYCMHLSIGLTVYP